MNDKMSVGIKNQASERYSNLELLRIIGMLSIIAHHFVVNSGIVEKFDVFSPSLNMLLLQLWGMWGKVAINVYVLISGYFMCTSRLTWKRFLKLFIEIKFYIIIFTIVFCVAGYDTFTLKTVFGLLIGDVAYINRSFTPSFLCLYLFIPILNTIIRKLETDICKLTALLLALFTVSASFFFANAVFHEVFWYITLYLLAACVRFYPGKWSQIMGRGYFFAISVFLACLSVVAVDVLMVILKRGDWWTSYYFVADSHKFFAFVVSFSAFLYFKNLSIPQSKWINRIASTTFGVLLIHANSDAMRRWLWVDLLNVPGMYSWHPIRLMISAVVIMFAVFAICSLIDMIRIRFIERPVFAYLDRHTDKIESYFKQVILLGKDCVNRIVDVLP